MQRYIPNTGNSGECSGYLGFSIELFADIPESIRLKRDLDLPSPFRNGVGKAS